MLTLRETIPDQNSTKNDETSRSIIPKSPKALATKRKTSAIHDN